MRKKNPDSVLPIDMIRAGHCGGIRVSAVDDRLPPEKELQLSRQLWRKARIWEMPEGFTLIEEGRDGTIYYRRGEAVVEFYWEFSGLPDIAFSLSSPVWEWVDVHQLTGSPVSPTDRSLIRQALIDYLAGRNISFVLEGKTHSFRKAPKPTRTKRGTNSRRVR